MVMRWALYDPHNGESWIMPINPREMSSPFPEKAVSLRQTTAIDGRALLFEGSSTVPDWTFSGRILTADHYAQLLYWSQKRNRITITDHFGRIIPCYLLKFDPTPKRAINRYWSHDYTMTAMVLEAPSAPTVHV